MSLDIYLRCGHCNADAHDQNITHNVVPMWRAAGVYPALYESHGTMAKAWIADLRAGIADMEDHPEKYEAMNPENGWGDYTGALQFLRNWLAACIDCPNHTIAVSR